MNRINLIIKRLVDLFGSFVGIIILAPILIIISVLIKLDSKGPIFFKQKRLGLNGKSFDILKFRTMVENAENIGDGLKVKSESDSRITKIGSFLRKTSLDELPQLFNVFIGNMSLVGPRPPVIYFPYDGYSNYPEWAKKRFNVKPGITGLAQAKLRASQPWDSRMKLDVQYVEGYSILSDIKIIIWTIKTIFEKDKIYLEEKRNE